MEAATGVARLRRVAVRSLFICIKCLIALTIPALCRS